MGDMHNSKRDYIPRATLLFRESLGYLHRTSWRLGTGAWRRTEGGIHDASWREEGRWTQGVAE
ncbi:hypothetical protein QJS10_CPA16g00213 [Acorus calamus]|uniref:Uncharacterized protein n=1 Tax=Acorus calamus TaxID=4465 RepID=A0AAV9D295_ACOCL|nr:hypothetical protein QJS10_CPA16g00213 [Acorus calamus]